MHPGMIIGELTVLSEGPRHPVRKKRQWWVRCSCGSPEYLASEENLLRPRTTKCKNCGVYKALSIGIFGDLTVLGITNQEDVSGKHKGYVDCICKCGITRAVWAHSLLSGSTTSCGKCYLTEFYVGQRVGDLEVVGWHGCVKGSIPAWEVRCLSCGSPTTYVVHASNLRSGNSTACRKCSAHGLQDYYRGYRASLGLDPGNLITPENRRARDEFQKLARYIKYQRDKRCLLCGEPKGLHAHHVVAWATHPELRFDPNNVASLCEECHTKAHSGKRNGKLDPHIQQQLIGILKDIAS